MTDLSELSRRYQAALEYWRAAESRYTTDEELAECAAAANAEFDALLRAWREQRS